MRLTLVNQFYAPDISPTAQLAASLAEHRAARGDDVTVITGRAGYLEGVQRLRSLTSAERTSATADVVRVRRVWTPDLGRASRARRLLGYLSFSAGSLVRLLALRRQDVIVSMTTPPFIVLAALAHKALHRGTRVVLWSMDCYPDAAERFGELRPGGLVSRRLRALNRWAFRRLDVVVSLDGAMAALLESQYAEAPGRPEVTVIPNWERFERFAAPGAVDPWSDYEQLDVGDRTVVLYLGNTGIGHRFDTVLAAAERLRHEALFLFVGGGARWDDLGRAVQERHLDNVAMRSYVPKDLTGSVMAGAHGALITLDDRSLGVMSPSKLHANLAAGLPVLYVGPIGSNVDEAIATHHCGVSLREGDVEGLVGAVRALRSDPDAGPRARRAFETAYCDKVTLPAFDAVLDG